MAAGRPRLRMPDDLVRLAAADAFVDVERKRVHRLRGEGVRVVKRGEAGHDEQRGAFAYPVGDGQDHGRGKPGPGSRQDDASNRLPVRRPEGQSGLAGGPW